MKRLIHFTLSLCLIGGSLLVAAEEKPLPKDLPAYGTDKPLPKMAVQTHTLANGLTVWMVSKPGVPTLTCTLGVKGGTALDAKNLRGATQIMASMLKEGTKTRSSRQIAEEAQGFGGGIYTGAGDDSITLWATGLASHQKGILKLLADVTLNPSFPAQELELEKANTLQMIRAQDADPGYQASKAFYKAIFNEHPYAMTAPEPEMIQSLTPELMQACFKRRMRPDQAILVVVGPVQTESILKEVQKAFGSWKTPLEALETLSPAPQQAQRRIVLVDRPGSVQSEIRIGRPGLDANHKDRHALALVSSVLGGGFDSRITHNIREDKGYTYSPGMSASFYTSGGSIQAKAAVRNEVTAAAVMELQYEFDRIGSTEITPRELESHKRLNAGIFLLRNQTQGSIAQGLAQAWLKGNGPEAMSEYVEKIQALSPSDVRQVARRLLPSQHQTVVVVGDAAKIRGDLEQFGTVEVVKP